VLLGALPSTCRCLCHVPCLIMMQGLSASRDSRALNKPTWFNNLLLIRDVLKQTIAVQKETGVKFDQARAQVTP